tara:strand:- start:446 stop:856 length:411 start_codon:yes stop_codon:yes gene_type:complete
MFRAKDIMHSIKTVDVNSTVIKAAEVMTNVQRGSVMVVENGDIVGIFTERDVTRKVVGRGKNPESILVKDVMSSPIISISGNTPLNEASQIMLENRIRRLPVTENGEVVGVLTTATLSKNLKYIMAHKFKTMRGTI